MESKMKIHEVFAIDLTPYQLALIHTCTDTDESTTRKILLRAPCTQSGAGRIEAQMARENEWKRHTFGPNIILPAHRFFVTVIDRATGETLGALDGWDSDETLYNARDVVWASRNPEKAAAIKEAIWNDRHADLV
jgi:hypothetical protein